MISRSFVICWLTLVTRPQTMGDDITWLINIFGPEYHKLLLGAGQLAEHLAMSRTSAGRYPICG